MAALLAILTFASAALGDFVETLYVRAVGELEPHRAARLSVAMYGVSCIGWYITIRVSLWYCVAEILGLYAGTLLAVHRAKCAKL